MAARAAALLVVAGGVTFAYWVPTIIEGLEIFWKIAPMMGIAFWLGLFWRRATSAGAWAATLAGFGVWYLTTCDFFIGLMQNVPHFETAPFVWEKMGDGETALEIYLPWQMIFYLSAGLAAGIVVSLFTRPETEEKLDTFYALVRTPSRAGEIIKEPCTLPEGIEAPPARKLFPSTGIELLWPSLLSTAGFLVCGGIVGLLVSLFYRIAAG
jgi:Na+/proline symporter